VSSFSELVKGYGFILVFAPGLTPNLFGFGAIGLFVSLILMIKKINGRDLLKSEKS